ncbi:MAG: transglycosylase SLT domain-containing protein [Acidobacteriota bacterium]
MRRLVPLVLLCACSGDDTHRHAPVAPHPEAAPAPVEADAGVVAPGTPVALTEAMIAPYWTSADEKTGAERFALEDWPAAKTAFTAARAATKDEARVARLELMLGLVDEHLADHASAATHLVFAHDHLPQLADFIAYHAARELWLAHDAAHALVLAKQIAPDSIVGAEAEILIGDLLQTADKAQVVPHYRAYLDHHPNGPFRSEARFRLAEALPPGPEKTELYTKIQVEDPLSSWADKSKAATGVVVLSGPEHLTRGLVLAEAHRNPEAEAELTDALADPKLPLADKCTASYKRAQARFDARDRKGAAPMFDEAFAACKAAKNTDLEIKANYQAGRSYSFIGQRDTAIARYQAAQKIDPKHSYSDDAMLREGEEWAAANDGAKVEAVLSAIPKQFPEGDMQVEAMWRLGWRAWREQRYDDAIKWWKEQLRLVKDATSYNGVFGDDDRAEAGYWLGRAYAAKKQDADAIAAWTEVVHKYPAAYYAMMSLNRLREAAPKQFEQVVAEISADPPGFDAKAPAFAFQARAEWSAPGFQRALELMRLGLGEPAGAELRKLGLAAPGDKKRVTDPDKLDKLWAIAWLHDRAGRYADSVWSTRWHILDYRASWPVGANRARWQIAYPKAYYELLSRHAKLNNVPIAMQIGIVREESGFDPLDESYANAVGLTQMIPPTAKDFSKGTGIDPTRENLRDPEKNVTIGSRFLGSLYKDWNGFTLLVPTSYNAGPGYVRRNLKARGTWDADEFVEGIADDQARNYTKRVLGTYFTYSWLYEHAVPEIPNKIPAELVPKH